jgi:sortase A
MRHDLLIFVSVSSLFALTGCASASSVSKSSPPTMVQATAPAVHTALLPIIVAPDVRHAPRATAQPPAALTATPLPVTSTTTPTRPPMVNSPTPKGYLTPAMPIRLLIAAINLDTPIVPMGWSVIDKDGQHISEWDVPDWRAAGWLKTSALVGAVGNTVLEGHQDMDGRVFENLEYLKEGDELQVQTTSQTRRYIIVRRTIVPEKNQPLEVRRENARWIGPSNDERLTLVTCWPRNDNTHRLILVALPAP